MKRINFGKIALHLVLTFSFCAPDMAVTAQNLSTEVVVDRDIQPRKQPATRPGWLVPTIVLPETDSVSLVLDSYTTPASFPASFSVLQAPQAPYPPRKSPYRGYVSLGYFPIVDFGISAGYRVVDKEGLRLDAFAQFDDERYRPFDDDTDMGVQYFVDAKAGLDLTWLPRENSELNVSAGYNFLRETTTYWYPHNVNSGRVSASWKSKAGPVKYSAAAAGRFEKASDAYSYIVGMGDSPLLPGLAQQQVTFDLSASAPVGPVDIGAALDGNFVHTSVRNFSTAGAIGITPFASYSLRNLSALVGIKFDVAVGDTRQWGGTAARLNVMPDIRLNFIPDRALAIWCNLTGGSVLNSFASARELSVYQVFTEPFGRSRLPLVVEGGVNVGPFAGFYAGVFGGYAIADKWLMTATSPFRPFEEIDVKGWHAGAKIGADWRFIHAEVSADFAPSAYNRAWYLRRDRAAAVIDATLSMTPINPLTITVGYQFRDRRKAYMANDFYMDLGCVSDLSAGAEWRFNPAFSAFCRFQNILCRRFWVTSLLPSRRLNGLIGIAYKF